MSLELIYAAAIGYLLGSIPFGLLLTRMAGQGDIREIGSGNIGATNVLRTGSRPLAAATLVLDAAKAAVAALLATYLWGPNAGMVAGVAAFIGHIVPVWLNFKGGKGVATMIGALLGTSWPVALIFCAVWLFIAFVRRISSLAALTAGITAPLFAYIFGGWPLAAATSIMTVLLIFRHRENIARILSNTEPKIGAKD